MKRSPIIRINPRYISRGAMMSAAKILLQGGLVAYPTETVYGLGANALNPRAITRVYQVKGRPANKPLIVLARNQKQIKELVKEIPLQAKTLMNRFWPDGLTLVFEASASVPPELLGGGTAIAVRISGHRVVRILLNVAGVPLISTSANQSGRPPSSSAGGVQGELGGLVDLILDGGRSAGAVPSTILDVRTTPVRVLRQGRTLISKIRELVDVEDVAGGKLSSVKMSSGLTVLFVCTGNTCRSAMAQGLLLKMLTSRGIGHVRVLSAGTAAPEGDRAARFAQQVAQDEDRIDLSRHSTHPLTQELLEEADLILTMALSHARHIESLDKRFARKTHLLTSFPGSTDRNPEDIDDPVGGSRGVYRRVYGRIKSELERIFPALVQRPQRWDH